MNGYIRIPRSLLRNPLWLDMPPAYKEVFLVILDHAVFIPTKYDDHGHMIELQPGQFCGSHADILKLSSKWISLIEIERAIKKLILYEFVRCEVRYRKSIITITHSDVYELILQASEVTNGVNLRQTCGKLEVNSLGNETFPSSPPSSSPPLSPSTPIPPLLSPPTPSHLEKRKKEKKIRRASPSSAVASEIFFLLFEAIKKTIPDLKHPNQSEWTGILDRMIRLDKRDVDVMKKVIEELPSMEFWSKTCLSAKSFREHFDRIKIANQSKQVKIQQPKEVSEETKLQRYTNAKKYVEKNWNSLRVNGINFYVAANYFEIGNDKIYFDDLKYEELAKHYVKKATEAINRTSNA